MAPSDETFQSDERLSGSTISSARFRQSTHMIPSPGSEGKVPKRFEPLILTLPVVVATPLIMLILGLALEIAIFISNLNNGFKVPQSNVFNVFGNVSAQFLASFIPTLLIIPAALAWRELDWNVRWYQPYVVLQKGNARAEESLLLDYIALGPFLTLFRAMNYKHRIVFWSSLTAALTYAFQPLSGSIFQIRQAPQSDVQAVTGLKSIGLGPDVSDLNVFVAAAGYVDASVLYNLPDPPFVQGGWATAEIDFPANPFLNGTLSVPTAGIQTTVNCSNPSEKPTLTPSGGTNTSLILSSKSIDGCVHSLSFDPNVATQQYGVGNVNCPGNASSLDVQFQPVMFWYFHTRASDQTQEVKTVFCNPVINAFTVKATANLNDGNLINVTKVAVFNQDNNVTGVGGLSTALVFNGVIFDNSTNPYINARAVATGSILPGAVFRAAQQKPNGPDSTFDLANGFLDLTSTLYTRHLSTIAKSVYFVDQNTSISGDVVSLVPRLVVDPLPAHLLSVALILTGIIGMVVGVLNRRQRKTLLLATPPGTIAATVALTSRSGFGELLLPYDDEPALEKKLDGLKFRLDRRTGAIVADDEETERVGFMMGPDDAMLSLLGNKGQPGHDKAATAASHSSSYLAHQAAAGVLPWEHSWAPVPQASPSRTEFVP
ncbi:hypothetical protein GALMADRAFT_252304 [Galerina marginata CBS 339.88]|uniref:Uncharacterized protein n=1 Tax=Galerina marginata (strain CBS 339.88) TaxID=685588 RepID=A0A067SQ13_GALM3|nr:hypothetical protein GALMADRAFT_252304 [Galerina marginata CBS 339.88]